MLKKKTGVFMPFFDNFYPFIKENFLKNYDKLIEFAENKNTEFKLTANDFRSGIYSMKISADYNKVIEKLKETKVIVENM